MKISGLGPALLRRRKGLRTRPAEPLVAQAHTLRTCCPNVREPASKAILTHKPSPQTLACLCCTGESLV